MGGRRGWPDPFEHNFILFSGWAAERTLEMNIDHNEHRAAAQKRLELTMLKILRLLTFEQLTHNELRCRANFGIDSNETRYA